MDLENLPPEIISQILHNIDSPLHLYRLLSASPVCLRVFSQSQYLVLSSVVRNTIPSYALDHYLALLNIPMRAGISDDWIQKQLRPFLELYFKSRPFSWPTSKDDLYAHCRIHNRLTYFIDGYLGRISKEFSPILEDKDAGNFGTRDVGPANDNTTALSAFPSESENVRLQRAFLRFELYCKIFSIHQEGHQYVVAEPAYQFNLFLARLEPWEVEEICCVYQHFTSAVESYINELEDKFVKAVLDAPGVVTDFESGPGHASPEPSRDPNEAHEDLVSIKNLELGDLSLFSKDWNHIMPRCISSIVSLGFEFLYELTRATETRRDEMIRANLHIFQDFLPDALRDEPISDIEAIQPDREQEDDPSYMNLGYRVFGRPDEGTYLAILEEGIEYAFLRHLGYVFWDSNRIRHPIVNDRLRRAKEATWDDLQLRFGRSRHKSAEERLTGILLPQKELSRLEHQFGSTRIV